MDKVGQWAGECAKFLTQDRKGRLEARLPVFVNRIKTKRDRRKQHQPNRITRSVGIFVKGRKIPEQYQATATGCGTVCERR